MVVAKETETLQAGTEACSKSMFQRLLVSSQFTYISIG